MANPKDVIKAGLSKLKAAPTDEAEDALETLNRKSDTGKAVNKKYHDDMPVEDLKKDIEQDMQEKQTPAKKADIREDKAALARKLPSFKGGGIQPKGTQYVANKRIQN